MFVGYTSNHKGGGYRILNSKTKKVSETRDVVFLNRIFLKTPKMQVKKKQVTNDADPDSVQQDKRGGTKTADFVACNDNASTVESMDSSVPDTPMVNINPGPSKYGGAYRHKMHYVPTTGRTIGTEATAIANHYQCLEDTDGEMEFSNVGAGIGGGFESTLELKQMRYKEAIIGPDGKVWEKEIENEYDRMVKNDAWTPVKKNSLPKGTKVIDSTCVCKKKRIRTLHGHLNARTFKEVEGVYYNGSSTHASATNASTIQTVLILMIMADWLDWIVGIKGAFLHGKFKDGEVIYMEVPRGFKKFNPGNAILKLKKCIYGLKQATMAFWHQMLICMKSMEMVQSTADSDEEKTDWS
jgi:hypothetical protein